MSWAKLSLGWDCGLVKIGFKTMEINFEINQKYNQLSPKLGWVELGKFYVQKLSHALNNRVPNISSNDRQTYLA